MIRLTLLLLAAIGITMVVAGRDPAEVTQTRRTAPPVEVTRADTIPTAPAETRLALDDEAGAIERALAATAQAEQTAAPAEEDLQTASIDVPSDSEIWYVTGTRVNLRAGPSTSTAVVGQATRGQRAELLDRTPDGWIQIRLLDDGQTAYIFGRFLASTPAG